MSIVELTARDANDHLERYRIVDVREEHEFHGPLGFIRGAELIPLSQVGDRASELRGERPLLLVCRSGKRSGIACESLQKHGIDNAINLVGGMIGWNQAVLPVVHAPLSTRAALVDQIVRWVSQVSAQPVDTTFEIARERFREEGVDANAPSHAAVEELIQFFGESLAEIAPPDLELSLASFRRSLAGLEKG